MIIIKVSRVPGGTTLQPSLFTLQLVEISLFNRRKEFKLRHMQAKMESDNAANAILISQNNGF